MINLLVKCFVKDYQNTKSSTVRQRYGLLGSFFGVISNFILFVIKIVVGFIFFSMSIISDALNNLTDFANCFISIFGFKMAKKPADEDHPYGHARMEYITSLIISFVVIGLGILTLSESIKDVINHIGNFSEGVLGLKELIITCSLLAFAVLVKVMQSLLYYNFYHRINSMTFKAVGADARNDTIATMLSIIGLIIGYFTKVNIDGYIGILISLFVIYSGIMLTKDNIKILLGEKIEKATIVAMVDKIKSFDGVYGVHDLEVHCYGVDNIYSSVHVEVNAKEDIMKTHDMIDNIERVIRQEFNIHLVIHMDPILEDDEDTHKLKELVNKCLLEIDSDLSIHDFRIVKGPTHTNAVFDLLLNSKWQNKKSELSTQLRNKVNEEINNVFLVINFDDVYSDLTKI